MSSCRPRDLPADWVQNAHGNWVCPVCQYEAYCLCDPPPTPDEARRIVGAPSAHVIVIPMAHSHPPTLNTPGGRVGGVT